MKLLRPCMLTLALLAGAAPLRAGDTAPPSFRNDVMAVISKSGCNAGACHGNKSGKAGFKLSLRGQDPDVDFDTLTRDAFARRTDPMDPDQSLLLLKATAQVPHEGGRRFGKDSAEYQIFHRWIAEGTPRDPESALKLVKLDASPEEQVLVEPAAEVRVSAWATFSDGSRRDVTRLACYEQSSEMAGISPDGLVRRQRFGETTVIVRYLHLQQPVRLAFVPARPEFQWSAPKPKNYIDEHVFAKLRRMRINPSDPCGDGEFARRAYLDLLGILPTAEEAKAFVADGREDKRERLIDDLLRRPEYADFWAVKWADLLRLEERALDRKGVQLFHRWIRQSIADNKPLDQFARELISARGSTYSNPPANFYRALRDPVIRGESVAQVFLGTRLNCAQCHNHPFDRWTQDDYYGWADVFSRVDYKVLENRRRDTNDGHEFVGEQVVFTKADGDMKDPRTGAPARPRLLGASDSPFAEDKDRLDALAEWMTRRDNPLFARAQVNRIWYYLMGRGIVDPIDDFRATNPPSHPALLGELAKDFVEHDFDVRHVIRRIMTSKAYALSSEPNDTNADDAVNYSHVLPRRLTAEQMLDAQHQVAGVPAKFDGYPPGMRAAQIPGVRVPRQRRRGEGGGGPTSADQFLVAFGKPQRELACDCERSVETAMGQVFQLISGPEVTELLAAKDNRLAKLLASGKSTEEIVRELYWTALTREATSQELEGTVRHLEQAKDRRQALEDVAWGLLNAKEFVLRK